MKQTTQELKAIRDGAPKTADYVSIMGYVLNESEDWYLWNPIKQKYTDLELSGEEHSWEIQSLADINEIITLREEVEAKDKHISELERKQKDLHNFLFDNANSLKDSHFYYLKSLLTKQASEVSK